MPAPLWLLASLFPACSSAPPPPTLVARDLFDADYEGNVSPLDTSDAQVFAFEPPAATAQPMQPIAFRATVLDLSIADANAFVPDLVAPPPAKVEIVDGDPDSAGTREWSDTRVVTRARNGVLATPRVRGIGLVGGHVEPTELRDALAALTAPGRPQRVVADSQGVVAIGGETAVTTSKQMAFVRALRYAAVADSFLIDDIDVETFEYGQQLRLAAHRDGDTVRLEVRWLERSPIRPIAVSGDELGRLQVPVLKRHEVVASTAIAPQDSIVLASLPGSDAGRVQLLCIEVVAQDPTAVSSR